MGVGILFWSIGKRGLLFWWQRWFFMPPPIHCFFPVLSLLELLTCKTWTLDGFPCNYSRHGGSHIFHCSPAPIKFVAGFTRGLILKRLYGSGDDSIFWSVKSSDMQNLIFIAPRQCVIVLHGLAKIDFIEKPIPSILMNLSNKVHILLNLQILKD